MDKRHRKGKKSPRYGKHHSEESIKKMSKARLGKHLSEKTKQKIKESVSGIKNPFYGKKHTKKSLRKMSNIKKNKHPSRETRNKMSKSRKGLLSGDKNSQWKGGKIEIKCKQCGMSKKIFPCQINKNGNFCSPRCSGIWINSHLMPNKYTSIEIIIENELIKYHIPYMKQVPLLNLTIVDFLLPNKIIIYCDGNYWHKKPGAKDKDLNQDFQLGFNGYRVFRFTETEINKSPSKCINRVLNFIKGGALINE